MSPPFGRHLAGLIPDIDQIQAALDRAELEAAILRRLMRLAKVSEKQVANFAAADRRESQEVAHAG